MSTGASACVRSYVCEGTLCIPFQMLLTFESRN